jgi:hypothetical protein
MRNSRCKRNQRQAGGGTMGGIVEFKADPTNQLVNNGVAWKMGSSCLDATASRPGFLSGGVTPTGLPGMSGGKRKGRKERKGSRKNRRSSRKLRAQSGGRYGFDASSAALLGGTPSTSGYAPVSSIPCEASRQPIPDNNASDTLNSRSSYLWSGPQLAKGMTGGGQLITPSPTTWNTHGMGPDGSNIGMQIDKASYTQNTEAPIQSAAGTNIMINTPSSKIYESAACFKTGGGKASRSRRAKTGGGKASRSRRAKTGGGRRSRKNRKNSRKNRKASRKNRKASRKH